MTSLRDKVIFPILTFIIYEVFGLISHVSSILVLCSILAVKYLSGLCNKLFITQLSNDDGTQIGKMTHPRHSNDLTFNSLVHVWILGDLLGHKLLSDLDVLIHSGGS